MFKTIYYCMCECGHMCVMVHMWRSEDHTHERILFLCWVPEFEFRFAWPALSLAEPSHCPSPADLRA